MSFKRVVITGMGALTPVGNDVPTFWSNLVAGVSGAAPITRFDAEKFRTRFACEVKGLDVTNYIPRQEARKMLETPLSSRKKLFHDGNNFAIQMQQKWHIVW